MHVFIDDSGCGGFKLDSGSTRHLVMAACVFKDADAVTETANLIKKYNDGTLFTPVSEFKYAKNSPKIKDGFFEVIRPCRFRVRAIVMDKTLIHSEKLRTSPTEFKSYAIMQLLTHTKGTVRNAHLVVDGRDNRAFGMKDSDYFRRRVNAAAPGTIRKVSHSDSKQDVMVQLADMIAGATRVGILNAKDGDDRHLKRFSGRTSWPDGSLWHFK